MRKRNIFEYDIRLTKEIDKESKNHSNNDATNELIDNSKTKVITRPNPNGKGPRKGLIVTFDDGTVICESSAIDTLICTAKKMGIKEIENLCSKSPFTILNPAGVKLVSKKLTHPRQRDIGNGYYVFSCTNTGQKQQQIEYLAKALGIKLKVEII